MGGYFTKGSNWLQLRPPVIPTQAQKHLSLRNTRIATIHKNRGYNCETSQKTSWLFFWMSKEDVSLISLKMTITKNYNLRLHL